MLKLNLASKIGILLVPLLLSSCANQHASTGYTYSASTTNYADRLPQHMVTREKTIVVDPNLHVWGAYNASGDLVQAGLATAGGHWCDDLNRSCKTSAGSFRINSIGNGSCKSSIYPKPNGGGLMPYCMFFNGGQALHGSPEGAVVEDNISHGCVRLRIPDAQWLQENFGRMGTKVVILPY